MSTKTFKISQLAQRWGMSRAWITRKIKSGELIARNVSLPNERPTYRIDADDAQRFWDSLLSKSESEKPTGKPVAASSSTFEDFVK